MSTFSHMSSIWFVLKKRYLMRTKSLRSTKEHLLYCHLQHHNDTIITTQEDFFINICTSHFIVRVRKGYSKFAGERELETEQKLQYSDPHSYGCQRCVFLVLLMLNRRPWGPLCWVLAFFTASYQQLLWSPNSIGVPSGPLGRVWLFLPHLVYNSVSNCNCHCNSVLTELYNSPTSTRSPTRSLEWHDWLSPSGNNCHAVHRSLSSGASVYECIMGFTLSNFISQIHPRDLIRLLAIGMCHFLPVHHFVMACLLGPKGKIQYIQLCKVYDMLYSEIVPLEYEAMRTFWMTNAQSIHSALFLSVLFESWFSFSQSGF